MNVSRATYLLAAATFCLLSGCGVETGDSVGSDDRQVMRAMVEIACKPGTDPIVISDRPAIPRESGLHGTDHRNVQFGVDFDRRLAHAARWPRRQVCPNVKVVADAALSAALAQEKETPPTWDHFSATFGGARTLMRISLPIYSRDGDRAVVYTESTCPYTCGEGFYHQLEKDYDGWHIVNSRIAWTS